MRSFLLFLFTVAAIHVSAQDSVAQRANLHFQTTYIYQYKPQFHAKYSGINSLPTQEEKENSLTATLYFGVRLWKGAEVYVNPELAGGSGLAGAFGMGASTNGETFRVGDPAPTLYLARAYFCQSFNLGTTTERREDGQNQLAGKYGTRYLAFYAGKFSLGDFFDNNDFSNSPRTQFMNWALMSNSAWDYSANLRGYTAGAVVVCRYDNMVYKVGIAAEPTVANGPKLNSDYGKSRGLNAEVTRAYQVHHKLPGHVRGLLYANTANMGIYRDAIVEAGRIGDVPDIIAVRHPGHVKYGFGLNADQHLSDNVGVFGRIGYNDGKTETWAFTESDRTISLGINVSGKAWKRANDVLAAGIVMNGLSKDHREYLAAGGLGFQLGDGNLNYDMERVFECYYSCKPTANSLWLSADYQFAMNPGYNKDRGPLSVFAFRLHVEL